LHKYGNIKWYILYVLFLIKMLELKPSIYIQCRFDINMDFVLKSEQSHYYFLNLFGEMKKK